MKGRRNLIFLGLAIFFPGLPGPTHAEESVAKLISDLEDHRQDPEDGDEIQENAIFELSKMGKAVVPAITEALLSKSQYTHCGAARTLELMGPVASDAIPGLIAQINNPKLSDKSCVLRAAFSVAMNDPMPLAVLFKHPHSDVRSVLIGNVPRFGAKAEPFIPHLIEALRDPNPTARSNAARAFGQLGLKSELIISTLTQALRDEDPGVRYMAADSLGSLGGASEKSVPALMEIFQSNQEMWIRLAAAKAVVAIKPSIRSSSPALSQFLGDSKESERISKIRPGDLGELPRLIGLLSDKRELVRNAAASKLAQFEQAARPAETKLEALANGDPSQLVRQSAAGALRSLRAPKRN